MDFFDPACRTGAKARYDDICANDYFDSLKWSEALAKLDSLKPHDYDEYRKAINKLAAHLSYSRITYAETKGFEPSPQLTSYLLSVATLFMRSLPPERAAWFGGQLAHW
jgi:hypothetical protein